MTESVPQNYPAKSTFLPQLTGKSERNGLPLFRQPLHNYCLQLHFFRSFYEVDRVLGTQSHPHISPSKPGRPRALPCNIAINAAIVNRIVLFGDVCRVCNNNARFPGRLKRSKIEPAVLRCSNPVRFPVLSPSNVLQRRKNLIFLTVWVYL